LLGLFFGLALPQMLPNVGDIFTRPFRVVALLLGIQLGIALMARFRRDDGEDTSWRFVSGCTLAGTLIFAFLHAFLSGQAFKAMFAALPLTVCVTAALYRALAGADSDDARHPMAVAAVVMVCVAIAAVTIDTRGTRRSADEFVPFTYPRLAGIHARPRAVESIEALLEQLAGRVTAGDFLLAYDDLPLVYYLTSTRPAIDHAWTSRVIPNSLRERSVRRMVAAGRVPRIAVRSLRQAHVGKPHAIHDFVERHYERERAVRGYEIWVLRDAPTATAGGRLRED
jgi:hypothetical protein